ncbi:MAG: hypothetical protein GWN01_10315 [Nitrosopumilaceae archaeon]|nr:hypothetical protein [Nitrosopumilaceae archaeon]NIU01292.1 hypothetical protein [Nitrosopumilaceae archaeon]NIU87640.1 hypothetical protein [Nitrosopumilaceae archaeon]NIV66065.1 hypothetical protein [Nitrosopumilaceae archaeon]NIX61894.1 hypothetical protein [Nitrosopumilaceae archaeon]
MQQPEILLISFSLAGLSYFLSGPMMMLQKKELVAWGIILRNDSIIAMVAVGVVASIKLLVDFVQGLIVDSAGSALKSNPQAFAEVMSQLVIIDTALITIVGFVSAAPQLQGFGILLGNMMGPAVSAVTTSIFIWTALQTMSNVMPTLFLTIFSISLVLWSIPFRVGRQAGAFGMALSMVLYVGLPLAAPAAIWVETYVLTSDDLNNLTGLADKVKLNILDPNFFTKFIITHLTEVLARLVSAIMVALIAFPLAYLGFLGLVTTSLASLLGARGKSIRMGAM